jgi:hypothetical protein
MICWWVSSTQPTLSNLSLIACKPVVSKSTDNIGVLLIKVSGSGKGVDKKVFSGPAGAFVSKRFRCFS